MSTSPPFAINGRFLTQAVTGVQRYAREITASLDAIVTENGGTAKLYTPPGVPSVPTYQTIAVRQTGGTSGYVWEQAVLPNLDSHYLLNLCNLGPALRANQTV